MSLSRPLLFLLLMTVFTGFINYPTLGVGDACATLKVDYSQAQDPSGSENTLTVKATGGKAPYHYVLLDGKNNLVSKDFRKNVFEGLKPGSYRCLVSDSNDCSAELEIKVQ
jgi:hypothetical protein